MKSGTLTTAKSALEYNRDIFAVPGDINRPNAEGPNFLIKNGAYLLNDPEQLLTYFNIKKAESDYSNLSETTQKVISTLVGRAATLDEIIAKTGFPLEQVMVELTKLEITGSIYQSELGKYQAK